MSGFSILDLLIGLAISSILAVIAIPSYQTFADRARIGQAIADISLLDMQIEKFYANNFAYPDSLAQLPLGPRQDPWESDYAYLRIDGSAVKGITAQVRKDKALNPINGDYDLYSPGADQASSTPLTAKVSRDDIVRAGNGGFIGIAEDF